VQLVETAERIQSRLTHRLRNVPVLVLMPHSACNCRCVMCDIWKANADKREITTEQLEGHIESLHNLGVRWVVLSGGEALMHTNLWKLCERLKSLPAKISLLTTGLLLSHHAESVGRWCDDVIVSVDGSREIHNRIRNIPRAYEKLAEGIIALRQVRNGMRVTGRCVLQKQNYFDLPNIIAAGRELGLHQISFLAADVFSSAFNRSAPWADGRVNEVALCQDEVREFSTIVEKCIEECSNAFRTKFIAESPDKLRRIAQYFAAVLGNADFPAPRCNAPWISTVIESDGAVKPCFFHPAYGNMNENSLEEILNSDHAVRFRNNLEVRRDPICRKCTCSIYLRPWAKL